MDKISQHIFKTSNYYLFVSTEKISYSPGDVINGRVYLQPIQPFYLANIELHIKAVEKVKWEKHINCKSVFMSDIRNIYDQYEILYQKPGVIVEGQYEFPFSFQIARLSPATFQYKSEKISAKIQYSVAAIIHGDKPNKYKNTFLVNQSKQRDDDHPSLEIKHKLFCLNKGHSIVEARFLNNHIFLGSDAFLSYSIRNIRSKIGIHSLKVQFLTEVRMRERRGDEFIQNIHNAGPEIRGVGPYLDSPEGIQKSFHFNKVNESLQMNRTILSNNSNGFFPSINGEKVQIKNYAIITPQFEKKCLPVSHKFEELKLELNLHYSPNDTESFGRIQIDFPPSWHPVIEKNVAIKLSFEPKKLNKSANLNEDENLLSASSYQFVESFA